jgi:hypothetical protein
VSEDKGVWRRFRARSPCWLFGHHNSGEYHHSVRVWQRCGRCGGWLGWMFRWQNPWSREQLAELYAEYSEVTPPNLGTTLP